MTPFLENLKERLRSKNMTQKELAEKTGISVNTIRGWFSKDFTPDVLTAQKIAEVLDTTIDYLVTGKNVAIPMDLEITIKQLEQFTYEERQPILFMLQGQIDYWKKVLQK